PVLFYINNTIIGYLNEASILKIEEEPQLVRIGGSRGAYYSESIPAIDTAVCTCVYLGCRQP
ncbi:hypothetical protein, partial [Desulfosporosinus nitroreducens]